MSRVIASLAFAAIGLWCAYEMLRQRALHGIHDEPFVAAVMLIGCTLLAPLPYLFGRPFIRMMAERNAEFWSVPTGLAELALLGSLGVIAALGWIFVVLAISGGI